MHMVRHATKAVDAMTVTLSSLLQQQVKMIAVIVVEKYIFSSVASHHYVIEVVEYMDSGFSCRARKLTRAKLDAQ